MSVTRHEVKTAWNSRCPDQEHQLVNSSKDQQTISSCCPQSETITNERAFRCLSAAIQTLRLVKCSKWAVFRAGLKEDQTRLVWITPEYLLMVAGDTEVAVMRFITRGFLATLCIIIVSSTCPSFCLSLSLSLTHTHTHTQTLPHTLYACCYVCCSCRIFF